jgi:hypothetical protein
MGLDLLKKYLADLKIQSTAYKLLAASINRTNIEDPGNPGLLYLGPA